MRTAIILGGGVTGCALARELTARNYEVTVIEQNSFLGGGCHTFFWGGHPYTEGPRPLHVKTERIFNYINEIVPLRKFHLFTDTYIERDRAYYSYPINMSDIAKMPDKEKIYKELEECNQNQNPENVEEAWINAVGETLYDKYVKYYTHKTWGIDDNRKLKGYKWSIKGKFIQDGDRFVTETEGRPYQAYPIEETGYNRFFEYCVKDATVYLNSHIDKIDLENKTVSFSGKEISGDMIFSTLAIDEFMNFKYGHLKYMGRKFYPIILPVEHLLIEGHHFLHYPNQEEYTRIVEYKNLTMHKAEDTLIVLEIPSHDNKLYTFDNDDDEVKKAEKYLMNLPSNVYSLGRMGSYKYLAIGDCFEQVWKLMEKLDN